MLNIAIYDTSGTMKRVTKRCNLFCSIDAKPVESREYFYFLLITYYYWFAASDVTLKYGVTPIWFYPIRSQYHATGSSLYLLYDRFECGW